MRTPVYLLVMTALAVAVVAQAQTAAVTPPVEARQAAPPRVGTPTETTRETETRQPRRQRDRRQGGPKRAATGPAGRRPAPIDSRGARPDRARASAAPSPQGRGILTLGATDITGNKELPKVMAIVPWKSPADAGGVIGPEDSLMNEALGPVDRGVLQRRIRYYGQLQAPRAPPASGRVAPVGDRH